MDSAVRWERSIPWISPTGLQRLIFFNNCVLKWGLIKLEDGLLIGISISQTLQTDYCLSLRIAGWSLSYNKRKRTWSDHPLSSVGTTTIPTHLIDILTSYVLFSSWRIALPMFVQQFERGHKQVLSVSGLSCQLAQCDEEQPLWRLSF